MTGRFRAPLAGVLSGLLFALAFPPVEWVLLLPLALVPWLVALVREESPGRAFWSGAAFGLAYWCASIPWIFYVVTHYGGQSGVMGVVCLVILAADPRGVAGGRGLGRGGRRTRGLGVAHGGLPALVDGHGARHGPSSTRAFPGT